MITKSNSNQINLNQFEFKSNSTQIKTNSNQTNLRLQAIKRRRFGVDFGQNFEYRFDELPVQGETTIPPWAGSYWPTYLDSINDRWDKSSDDTLSPAKKYETAFGKTGIEDAVSLEYGVDSMKHRTPCTDDSVCNATTGEKCSKRHGQENGYCVETWFGICHAWGPAAVLEPEPINPVTYNGVEFKVQDIKALITLSYDFGLKAKSLSETCEIRNTGGFRN